MKYSYIPYESRQGAMTGTARHACLCWGLAAQPGSLLMAPLCFAPVSAGIQAAEVLLAIATPMSSANFVNLRCVSSLCQSM